MDDRQLAAGIRRKEEEALDELINQYGHLIKSIATYHLGDFYRDECINDVLFCIWNHIDQYNPEKNSLKNWIGAICKYKCIDYKRKYYKENFVELDETIPVADQTEKIILEQELEVETNELLSSLSPKDRELFRRRYINEESIEEISRDMNLAPSVLYNRLSRGKKKLRNTLRRSHNET